jgi:hypothetical protein
MKAFWIVCFCLCACGKAQETKIESPPSCDSRATQREADICFYDALLATDPLTPAKALGFAQNISDPIIQGAAILKWVQEHNRQIQPQEGRKLCRLLGDRERTACERRLYSAHLQR